MSRAKALKQLRAALPRHAVITERAALKPYETDGLTAIRELPWVVALPETVDQVRAVLRICADHDVPVVARGAGTGLSGGARPVADGVVLGLSKLNRILEIDLENCVARLQPGVRNLAISEAVAEHGLYYAPDPSSQIACSIGGNVAENSGGV
ncbi:MAG: FAD-binding protein, partial [Pseudomonadales bacterium]